MTRYLVDMYVTVEIESSDEDHIERVLAEDWQAVFTVMDRDGALEMLARSAIVGGLGDASDIDGWGDLDRGELTMTVVDASLEGIEEIPPALVLTTE